MFGFLPAIGSAAATSGAANSRAKTGRERVTECLRAVSGGLNRSLASAALRFVLVDHLAVNVVVAEDDRLRASGDRQEAALHAVELVVVLVLAGRAAGVLVARGAHRELVQP